MKVNVRQPIDIEPVAIRLVVAVRYGEEDMPKDFPFRIGDTWDAVIDIDTGKIRDWPEREAELYMKVCDEGSYYLLDAAGKVLAGKEMDYVPDCIPGEYGDYIDFKIAKNGMVLNWKEYCDASSIKHSFYGDDE